MVFLLLRLGLTLWMACCVAHGYVISPGASRQAVIDAYGHPESQARTEAREILNYQEGSVLLVEGRVVELRFSKAEPAPFRHRRSLEPSPVSNRTARVPTPTTTIPTSPQIVRTENARFNTPSTVQPHPSLRVPADRGTGFRIWIPVLWALVAMMLIKPSGKTKQPDEQKMIEDLAHRLGILHLLWV